MPSLTTTHFRRSSSGTAFRPRLDSRFRWLAAVHIVWGALCCVLSVWWGSLILSKSTRIVELEAELHSLRPSAVLSGRGPGTAGSELARTRRMLWWEGGTFFTFVAMGSVFLLWLDRRDTRRARAIQAFFASVTHELRTPLTSIRLQAETIADALGSDRPATRHPGNQDETQALIGRLLEDTTRLESQVEQALELARVEGGGNLLLEPIALGPYLERAQKAWKTRGPATFGTLEIQLGELSELEPEILGDPGAIQIILRNLLENTLRHGGTSAPRVSLSVSAEGERVAVTVRDNGRGPAQDPKELGRLFEKGPSSRGAGVGLYLVRQLMKSMGGSCEFAKAEGGGFEATLWFRRAPAT